MSGKCGNVLIIIKNVGFPLKKKIQIIIVLPIENALQEIRMKTKVIMWAVLLCSLQKGFKPFLPVKNADATHG